MKVLQVICLFLLATTVFAQIQIQERDDEAIFTIDQKSISVSIDRSPQLPNGIKIGIGPQQEDFQMYLSILYQLDESKKPIMETAKLLSEYEWIFPSPTLLNNFVQLIMVGHPKEGQHDIIIQMTIDKDRITTLMTLAGFADDFKNNSSFLGIRTFITEKGMMRDDIFSEPKFQHLHLNKTALVDRQIVPVSINFDYFASGTPTDIIFEKFKGDLTYAMFVDLDSSQPNASQIPSPIPSPTPSQTPDTSQPLSQLPTPTTGVTPAEQVIPTPQIPAVVPPQTEAIPPAQPSVTESPASRMPNILGSLEGARRSPVVPTDDDDNDEPRAAQTPRSILENLIRPSILQSEEDEEILIPPTTQSEEQPAITPIDQPASTPVVEADTPTETEPVVEAEAQPDDQSTPENELTAEEGEDIESNVE